MKAALNCIFKKMSEQLLPKHYLSGKTIVIAGGGVAGLAFAVGLRKLWPSTTTAQPPTLIIYERDTAEDAIGREGYSLSLRSDPPGGIQALQRLGVLEDMIAASIEDVNKKNGGFCIWDKKFNPILKVRATVPPGLPVGSLRISRRGLRKVLVQAAEAAGCKIHWDVRCTGLSSTPSSPVTTVLSTGSTVACDMVVAADGASSKLRAQLRPHDTLQFQNTVAVGGTAVYPVGTSPPEPVDRDWGLMPLGIKKSALFFSPVSPNTAIWSMSFRTDTPIKAARSPVPDDVADWALKTAKERILGLPPLYYELVDRTDRNTIMVMNARDKYAFGHGPGELPEEFGRGKVVFIGDANHAVTPFAGNGANMALCDGWELAVQLLSATSAEEAVQQYDKLVVPERNKVVRQSHIGIAVGHAEGWRLWLALLFLRIMKMLLFKYVH